MESTPFFVTICDTKGIAKDLHPKGNIPIKPFKSDFKEDKYSIALLKYEGELKEWEEVDKTLKRYTISKLRCVSGIYVNADILNWHLHSKENAILQEDGTSIIISDFK